MPSAGAPAAVTQAPPKPVATPNWQAAEAGRPADATDKDNLAGKGNSFEPPEPRVKLINPDHGEARAATAEPVRRADDDVADTETDQQGLAACARRYSSFRRSDGSYQPFGGGPRQRCPLLR